MNTKNININHYETKIYFIVCGSPCGSYGM